MSDCWKAATVKWPANLVFDHSEISSVVVMKYSPIFYEQLVIEIFSFLVSNHPKGCFHIGIKVLITLEHL